MRIEFINAAGGVMLVDESRKDEYLAAGYMLAANVVDSTARIIEEVEEAPAKKKRPPKKKADEV